MSARDRDLRNLRDTAQRSRSLNTRLQRDHRFANETNIEFAQLWAKKQIAKADAVAEFAKRKAEKLEMLALPPSKAQPQQLAAMVEEKMKAKADTRGEGASAAASASGSSKPIDENREAASGSKRSRDKARDENPEPDLAPISHTSLLYTDSKTGILMNFNAYVDLEMPPC
jgi:hypothetical protein